MTKEKESPFGTLKDVEFYWTSVEREIKQLNKDNKPPLSDDPLEFHSWEVKICIPESRYKKLKKKYQGAKNFPNVKEFTPKEYADKLSVTDTESDEDMVLIKFAQGCLSGKKGNRKPSRKIQQIGIRGKVQDYDGNTIDETTRVGNGSKGHIQFRPVETEHGLYLYPSTICITELLEYVESEAMDEDAFGLEELAEVGMSEGDDGDEGAGEGAEDGAGEGGGDDDDLGY